MENKTFKIENTLIKDNITSCIKIPESSLTKEVNGSTSKY